MVQDPCYSIIQCSHQCLLHVGAGKMPDPPDPPESKKSEKGKVGNYMMIMNLSTLQLTALLLKPQKFAQRPRHGGVCA
jgi:hypothetical protein